MKYLVRTPFISRLLYPSLIWKINCEEKELYITFDDGPDPVTTPRILKLLETYDAKATFFCTGKRALKYPELINEIIKAGHTIGNHTFNHLNGWKTEDSEYIGDINRCLPILHTQLFRPPYGRIRYSQIRKLKNDFKIILWTVLPGDFDTSVTIEQCLKNAIENTNKGSIIVFHDSQRYFEKLSFILPEFLEHFFKNGYCFRNIEGKDTIRNRK